MTTTTVQVEYLFENEDGGYTADIVATLRVASGCDGDDITPPAPPEFELIAAEAVTITTVNYSHAFAPADGPAERAIRQIAEAGFFAAYEADDYMRREIEEEAAEAAEAVAMAAREVAREVYAETCRQAAGRF
jgi:hypothetical protein